MGVQSAEPICLLENVRGKVSRNTKYLAETYGMIRAAERALAIALMSTQTDTAGSMSKPLVGLAFRGSRARMLGNVGDVGTLLQPDGRALV